jgi:hypothetical protein
MSIGDSAGAAEILKISPVAWHHINFRVRYKFRSGETPIDIEAIVREVAKIKVEFDFDVAGIGFGIYLLEGMCKKPHTLRSSSISPSPSKRAIGKREARHGSNAK